MDEIVKTFESEGLVVEVIFEQGIRINDVSFRFVPAGEDHESLSSAEIIIHEDLFHRRKEQLIARMRSVAGLNSKRVHGRQTRIKELSREEAKRFTDAHHLMGFGGGKTFLGLVDREQLVAVAIFSKIRWMKYENPPYNSVELERFCVLTDTTVVGGLDKLIRHYLRIHEVDDIVTYIDKEWSDGSAFLKLGFEWVEDTAPLMFCVDKETYKRRLFLPDQGFSQDCFLIKNLGNMKLKLRA